MTLDHLKIDMDIEKIGTGDIAISEIRHVTWGTPVKGPIIGHGMWGCDEYSGHGAYCVLRTDPTAFLILNKNYNNYLVIFVHILFALVRFKIKDSLSKKIDLSNKVVLSRFIQEVQVMVYANTYAYNKSNNDDNNNNNNNNNDQM